MIPYLQLKEPKLEELVIYSSIECVKHIGKQKKSGIYP